MGHHGSAEQQQQEVIAQDDDADFEHPERSGAVKDEREIEHHHPVSDGKLYYATIEEYKHT